MCIRKINLTLVSRPNAARMVNSIMPIAVIVSIGRSRHTGRSGQGGPVTRVSPGRGQSTQRGPTAASWPRLLRHHGRSRPSAQPYSRSRRRLRVGVLDEGRLRSNPMTAMPCTTGIVRDQLDQQHEQLERTLDQEQSGTWNERFATAADRLGSDRPPAV